MSRPQARIPLADLPAPGQIRIVEVGGHRIGLLRVGDEVHALADRCPHRGAPLCSGGRTVHGIELGDGVPVRGAERALLRCPWHKWDFDIASGRCVVHPTLRVRRYRVTVDDEDVVVHLQHPAAGRGAVVPTMTHRPPVSRERRGSRSIQSTPEATPGTESSKASAPGPARFISPAAPGSSI